MAERHKTAAPRRVDRAGQDPSPTEIRHICEQIRSQWSPRERNRRAGLQQPRPWSPPVVRGIDIPGIDETR